MICNRTPEALLQDIENFHGFVAPGLLIGAFMIDLINENFSENFGRPVEADAIVETRHCLPDAVQIFTPCTIGNGWLKIIDLDKFALSLYDRHTFEGYRTWLDPEKAKAHKNVYNWFMGLVSKKDLPKDILLDSIFAAGKSILSIKKIKVIKFGDRKKKGEILICDQCREAYSASQGIPCLACQGDRYYQSIS